MAIGVLLAGFALIMIGLLVFPRLVFPRNRPVSEPLLATESNARVAADRLDFSMSDQEITDAVLWQPGAVVGALRREGDVITVLVSVPDSIVEPRTHACYRFTLRRHREVSYEEAQGCPAVRSP
ncbi:MAG: hypothetical protein WBA97_25195 [Actinophytocola sp.]|uniref:hypothetical protein n=1 Tax=Actinophytocola sp. TaxID=1872138 RepID=UPI003C77BFF3